MDDKKTVEVLFKFGIIDEAEAKKAKKVLDGVSTSAATAKKNIIEVRESMEKLSQVGMKMSMAGAAILAPFILASNKYVTATQRNEAASARWLDNTKRIEQAQIRLGRSATTILNPALEATADAAEKIISTMERNPAILQGIMSVGGGLLGVGATITAVAQMGQIASTLQLLADQGGAAGMAGKAGIALGQVTLLATSVIIGAEVGAALGNAINSIINPGAGKQTIADALATPGSLLMGGLAAIYRGTNHPEWAKGVEAMIPEFKKFMNTAPLIGTGGGGVSNGTGGIGSRTRGENTSEVSLGQQRIAIIASYAQKILDIEKNYAMQRETAIANFALQQKQAAKQHQLELKRMEKQHGRNMDDLVAARDALGMVKEEQRYKDERADSQAAYKLQQQQARENFNLQLQQMAQAKNEQLRLQAQAQAKELQLLSYALKYKAMAETAYANQMIAIGNKFMAGIGSAFGSPKAKNYSQGEVLGSAQGGNLSNSNINVTIQGDGLSVSQIQRAVSRNNASIIGGIGSAMRMATR